MRFTVHLESQGQAATAPEIYLTARFKLASMVRAQVP